jgi:hypothetical protein
MICPSYIILHYYACTEGVGSLITIYDIYHGSITATTFTLQSAHFYYTAYSDIFYTVTHEYLYLIQLGIFLSKFANVPQ